MTTGVNVKFMRKDIGGNYCVHIDAKEGRVGFSRCDDGEPPARPPHAEVWLEDNKLLALYHMVKRVVEARGFETVAPMPAPPPVRQSASPFFQSNFNAILAHKEGKMKKPPLWLRWLYSAVVTKELYDD